MLVVGEKINTSVPGVEEAVKAKDETFIQNLARKQVEAGADILDINVGTRIHSEVGDIKWITKVVQETVSVPLCIDSPSSKAIEAGLAECKSKVMVNSITAERERMEGILPLLKKYSSKIIALTMDGRGIPEDVDQRCEIAEKLIGILTEAGIPLENIYIDPLIRPISTDSSSGLIVLNSIERIMRSFKGVHTICGLSNISFGLPKRALLNRSFLLMAMSRGLDSVILDPLDREMMAAVRTGEALLGKDEHCLNYLTSFREGKL